MFKIKEITEGFLIPWGLSWFRSSFRENDNKRRLVLCIRLPFYWVEYDYCYDRECWGSAVLRIRFWDKCHIVWVPDFEFGRIG